MTRFPSAIWTLRDDLNALSAALGPQSVRWVGGAVRDTLLGQPVHDIDAATLYEPPQVIDRLNRAGIRTVPTGIAHGTVTALLDHGPVEITTLRRDVSTNGRHATVEFATKWEDDAARRDFTINALYVDPASLELFDYFDGMADLAAGRVRFIGDAKQRIAEDHLRILRYYRFQCRFGAVIDDEAEEACIAMAPTLKGLSRERVASELLRLLALPDPAPTVRRMIANGVLPVILPDIRSDAAVCLEKLVSFEREQNVEGSAIRRMASLLPADPRIAEQTAATLRLSTQQRRRLVSAAKRIESAAVDPLALDYTLGREGAVDQLLLEGASTAPLLTWQTPVMPLKGGEIVERGLAKGPDVARLLYEVEQRWIAEGFPPRERVEMLLNEAIQG